MNGEVTAFYVTQDRAAIVMTVTDPVEGSQHDVLVSREQLQYMMDAEPLYQAPKVQQNVTPRSD